MLMNGKTFIPAFDFILMIFGLATIYESYDRMTFEMMQQKCAARGVTIISAIEAPGHVLVISQWKPELRTLNLSQSFLPPHVSHNEKNTARIPSMGFKSKQVHSCYLLPTLC